MVTLSDGLSDLTPTLPLMSHRAHITATAGRWLNARKQPGEELGLGVDHDRDGWQLVIRTGDVAVTAHCGQDPSDDVIAGVLAGLVADARKKATLGAEVKARRAGTRPGGANAPAQ